MLGGLKNRVDETKPDLVDFSEVSSVQVGVGDGPRLLPFSLSSSQFPGYLFKIRTLLELLVLCAVSY